MIGAGGNGMTFYAILGIPSDADQETIRSSYRNLVRRYHPDAGSGSSPEKFRHVVEAYETLSDPQRREAYDRTLRRDPEPVRVRVHPKMRPEPLIRRSPFDPPFAVPLYGVFDFDDLFEELIESLQRPFFRSPWDW